MLSFGFILKGLRALTEGAGLHPCKGVTFPVNGGNSFETRCPPVDVYKNNKFKLHGGTPLRSKEKCVCLPIKRANRGVLVVAQQ